MAQANLKAVVTAQDSASPTIAKVANSTDKLGSSISSTNQKASESSASFSKLGTSVGVGIAAYEVLSTALQKTISFMGDSLKASKEYQGAMIGLASVSASYGQSASAAGQAAQSLATDGLMTVTDAATGLKNLLGSGFSLPQAIQLMSGLKDQAAFNRQSFYDLGGAVKATTEGIKNGNSVLADATGTTKNLSVMAKEAGVGIDEMGSINQNAGYRTAVLNGFLRETARSAGDAARYSETFAGAQDRAGAQTRLLQKNIGDMIGAVGAPLLSFFASFIERNRQLVSALIVAGTGATIFAVGLLGIVKIAPMVAAAIAGMSATAWAAMGVFGVLAAVLGAVLFKAFKGVQEKVTAQNDALVENAGSAEHAKTSTEGLSDAQTKLGKQIAKVNQQIERENRSYQESLAEMIRSHQDKVKSLKTQLGEEDTSFKESQESAALSYQERVAKIQAQIAQETNLGSLGNQQRLADLRASLAQETMEYDKKAAQDLEKHNKKMAEMQLQLDAETALLKKHAGDVASVRGVQLLDEIDKLKRSHKEQLASYREQKADILSNANKTAAGIVSAFAGQKENAAKMGGSLGGDIVGAMNSEIKKSFTNVMNNVGNFAAKMMVFIQRVLNPFEHKSIGQIWKEVNSDPSFKATGGNVQAGSPYIVGEQGREMFVPSTNGRIVPNNKMASMGGSGGGGGVNITVQAGAFMGTQMEARKFAEMIMNAYQDAQYAKGMTA